MRLRGITTPNNHIGAYASGRWSMWEPVLVCDSDLLTGMLLMAWGGRVTHEP